MNPSCRTILISLWFVAVWMLRAQEGVVLPTYGHYPGNGETNVTARPLLHWQWAGLTNLVRNGQFIDGLTNWNADGNWQASASSGARTVGFANAAVLWQEMDLPADAVSANLAWEHVLPPARLSSGLLQVEVRDTNNVRLALLHEVTFRTNISSITGAPTVDLTPWIGQRIRLAFIARVSGDSLRVRNVSAQATRGDAEFAVRMGSTPLLAEVDEILRTRGLNHAPLRLHPGATHYWQVVAIAGGVQHAGPVVKFGTAPLGQLAAYEFNWGDRLRIRGEDVPLEIVAVDAKANLVSTLNTNLSLRASGETVVSPSVLFSEFQVGPVTNGVEVMNVTASPVDLDGWQLLLYVLNDRANPQIQFRFPAGSRIGPGAVATVRGWGEAPGASPEFRLGTDPGWSRFGTVISFFAAVLVDPGTNVMDFAAFGRSSSTNIAGLFRVPAHQWRSAAVPLPGFITEPASWQRTGRRDGNEAGDWTAGEPGLGAVSATLELPLLPGPGPLAVSPAEVSVAGGVWQGRVRFDQVGTNVSLSVTNASSLVGRSAPFNVQAAPYLMLGAPETLAESAGTVANALRLVAERAPQRDVLVRLAARPDDALTLPLRFNWPAGVTEWRLPLTPRDNRTFDGPRRVEIYGEGEGFAVVATGVTILDDESATLSLQSPASVEESSTNELTVSLSAPPVVPLRLQLSVTGEPRQLRVPAEVTVPAGSAQVTVRLEAPDNGELGEAVTNRVTVSYPGNPGVTLPITVRDNEPRSLMLLAATNVFEGRSVQTNGLTVQVPGALRSALTIQLISGDTNRVRLPASVVLPAGASEVAVALTNVDNATQEGPVPVVLRAVAEGFAPAEVVTVQHDNDPAAVVFGPIASPQVAGNPFEFTLQAVDVYGQQAPAFSGIVGVIQSPAGDTGLVVTQQVRLVNGMGKGTNIAVGPRRLANLRTTGTEAPTGLSGPFNVVAPLASPIPVEDARDLRASVIRNRLYVSVGSSATQDANSVLELDPGTLERIGRIEIPEPIGPGTGTLAVADDGSTLFVATGSGEFKVVRVNLNSRKAELTIPLRDQFGQYLKVTAMELGPEPTPEPRLILTRFGGTRSGVINSSGGFLYDAFPSLVFMDRDRDTGAVYGRINDLPHQLIYRLDRVSEPPVVMRTEPDYPANRTFAIRDGRFFQPDGTVLDLATGRQLVQLDVPGIPVNYWAGRFSSFLFSQDGRRLGVVGQESDQGYSLRVFELDTWELLGVFPLDWWQATLPRLVPLPGGKFAGIFENKLLRLDLPQLEGSAMRMDLGLKLVAAPARITMGEPVTNHWRITNQGAGPASDIRLLITLPAGAQIQPGRDAWVRHRTQTNTFRADCVSLDAGEVRDFEFVWSATTAGPHPVLARVIATELELTPADNGVRLDASVELPAASAGVIPLSWQVNDLAYSAGRQRAYATGTERGMATVWELDPVTGRGTGLRQVVAPAGRLHLSRNQRFLYVAVAGGSRLLRVDLDGALPDLEVAMGTAPNGQPLLAREFRAVPGQPESVAVFRAYRSPTPPLSDILNFDLAIFDGAVMRPTAGPTWGQYALQSQFEFGPDGRQIFATGAYDPGILVFAVTAEGVSPIETRPTDPSLRDWRHFDGRLFATDGRVFDPVSLQVIARLPGLKDAALMDLASERGRGLFFDPVAGNLQLCDLPTLMPMSLVSLPGLTDTDAPRAVRDLGPGQAAVITPSGKLIIVRSPALRADGVADLSVRPRAVPASQPVLVPAALEWEISNAGPDLARSVTVQLPVPGHVRIGALAVGTGTVFTNGLGITAELGDLAPGSKVTVTVTLTPLMPIALTNIVTVAGGTAELASADNRVVTVVPVTRPTGPDNPRVLELAARDLVYHPDRGLLYAAVAGNPGVIQPIRPETGERLAPLAVSGDPGMLRLSDNGRYLFVGRTNRGDVVRVDLDNGSLVPYSAGPEGQFRITVFEPDPADPDSLITVVHGPTGGIWRLTPSGPVGQPLAYAAALLSDPAGRRVLAWGINGNRWLRSAPEGLLAEESPNGLDGESFVVRDGRAIPNMQGSVTDIATLLPVGSNDSFHNPLVRLRASGPTDGDLASGRIFMVRRSVNPASTRELRAYDWHSLTSVDSELLNLVLGDPRQLVRWGARGLALRTDADELFLWETRLIPAGTPTDLRLESDSPPPAIPNEPVRFEVRIRNAGNRSATNVVVGFVPAGTSTFEIRQAGKVVSDANQRLWRGQVDRLAAGATASFEVVASYRFPGWKEISAHVTSAAPEATPADNHLVLAPEIRIAPTNNAFANTGLSATDLAFGTDSGLLYAADPDRGVFALEPSSGLQAGDFAMSGGARRLALADGGRLAHVLSADGRTVSVLSLESGFAEPLISLKPPWIVTDLLPVPGRPEAVVVSICHADNIYETGEVALFINGVKQPAAFRAFAGPNRLHYGSDGMLYGVETYGEWQSTHIARLRVGADGIETMPSPPKNFSRPSRNVWEHRGILLNDTGERLDLLTGELLGRLSGAIDDSESLSVAYDAATDRLLAFGNSVGLSGYDGKSFALVGRAAAPFRNGSDAVIVRCGGDRVATLVREFGQSRQTIHIHRLEAFPVADLRIEMAAPGGIRLAGEVIEFQLSVTNRGPAVATNSTVNISISGSGAPGQPSAGTVLPGSFGSGHAWHLPRLAAGESATLSWIGRATNGQDGSLVFAAAVESATEDPVPTDNEAVASVDVLADNDRDLLPDSWEASHGLNPRSSADASADADGDGYDNATELFAGTDPADSADAPRLLVEPTPLGLRVAFHSQIGRRYQVEARSELEDSPWFPVGSARDGDGTVVSLEVPPPVGGSAYWRLVIRK